MIPKFRRLLFVDTEYSWTLSEFACSRMLIARIRSRGSLKRAWVIWLLSYRRFCTRVAKDGAYSVYRLSGYTMICCIRLVSNSSLFFFLKRKEIDWTVKGKTTRNPIKCFYLQTADVSCFNPLSQQKKLPFNYNV